MRPYKSRTDDILKLPFGSVSVADLPSHAVLGRSDQFGSGVISWHCDEFSAYGNAKFVRKLGGTAEVRKIDSPEDISQEELFKLMFD
jgi:hypothetical protein